MSGITAVILAIGAGSSQAGDRRLAARAGEPAASSVAAASGARVALKKVARFSRPVYVAAAPRDPRRVFVVEQAGRIMVVRDGRKLSSPFLNLSRRVSVPRNGGLLSIAFAPDYGRSRRFYVFFTDRRGFIRVVEFRRAQSTPDRALRASGRLVILQRHFNRDHKGGQLQFGPDGMLYVGFGDSGLPNDRYLDGQNLRTMLAKVIRLDPRPTRTRGYRIPRDNPFAGRPAAREEIWAYGVRNPYRFSFDRLRGHFTVGDVGQDAYEEVHYLRGRARGRAPRGGANFGWSLFEGRHRLRSGQARRYVPPVIVRSHRTGSCALIGGYVIRDRSLGPLYGRYLYGDYCDPELRTARLRTARASHDRPLGARVPALVSFGEDSLGRLYAVSLQGVVYRLQLR